MPTSDVELADASVRATTNVSPVAAGVTPAATGCARAAGSTAVV